MKPISGLLVAVFATLFHASSSEQLLHSVDGNVGRGNYTYYSLMYEGPISLYLYSTLGDADLYVSQLNTKPTFEPDSYCLQSSTCGLDIVRIPGDFNRPVGIGVYGHPSHELSSYLLEVRLSEHDHNDSLDSFPDPDRESDDYGWDASGRQRGPRGGHDAGTADDYYAHERRNAGVEDEDKEVEESFFWTLLWSFFDILVEILFL